MSEKITVGLLPLYIKLYDEVCPDCRPPQERFAQATAKQLEQRGFKVVAAPVCRIRSEFEAGIKFLENSGCEAMVTLHLAYSPSLESIEAVSASSLPVVILDTTPDPLFTDPATQLMANHGIHGVQDFGNMLLRYGKPFLIAAGASDDPQLYDRAANLIRSAAMSYKMNHLRVGRFGGEFAGMGDFRVPAGTFGMQEIPWKDQPEPSGDAIQQEMEKDLKYFRIKNLPEAVHKCTLSASLKVRNWVDAERLDAFTMSFPGINYADGWKTVPFLECSKSMARGIGYAGEGDVLTAGLHAALFRAFPQCGFSEMFCPDWKGNRIYTSHMGEINLALTSSPALLTELNYIFSDTGHPAVAYGCYKPGKACCVNLAPGPDRTFTLIAAPVEFLEPPASTLNMAANAGWFRPQNNTVASFLEQCTEAGITHHSVVVYDCCCSVLCNFAKLMGWEYTQID